MYVESKNKTKLIPNEILIALIQASDAYLENPTQHNWHTFQELSDSILEAETSFDATYFLEDEQY